ncbi:MAG: hypothetical protein ACK513_18145, partial [Aphanizomenon sp.]
FIVTNIVIETVKTVIVVQTQVTEDFSGRCSTSQRLTDSFCYTYKTLYTEKKDTYPKNCKYCYDFRN